MAKKQKKPIINIFKTWCRVVDEKPWLIAVLILSAIFLATVLPACKPYVPPVEPEPPQIMESPIGQMQVLDGHFVILTHCADHVVCYKMAVSTSTEMSCFKDFPIADKYCKLQNSTEG